MCSVRLITEVMWLSYFKLFWMVTPRYLADVTASSVCPFRLYDVSNGFLLLVTYSTLHIPILLENSSYLNTLFVENAD